MVITYGPRDSRCLYEANAPQAIHWATLQDDPVVSVGAELIAVIRANTRSQVWADVAADVRAILERFQQCVAIDPEDIKPIAQDGRLWEIRIDLTTDGLLLRIYETEIPELPGNIVALLCHHKVVVYGDEAETRRMQDEKIGEARSRWDRGRPTFWGLP